MASIATYSVESKLITISMTHDMATVLSKQTDVETLEDVSKTRIVQDDYKGEGPALFEGMSEEEMKALESKCNTSHLPKVTVAAFATDILRSGAQD